VLAAQAYVVPADDFLVRCHRHPGGDVACGCGGEVSHFLKEAGGGSGGHLLDGWRFSDYCGRGGTRTRGAAKQILNAADCATFFGWITLAKGSHACTPLKETE
jgi:hypothetical protein